MEDETLSLLSSSMTTWENVIAESSLNSSENNSIEESEEEFFEVQSLGWLPIDYKGLRLENRSSAVNSCIRVLAGNRNQIMDGVGVWGEGMNLILSLNDEYLKVKDKFTDNILQMDAVKSIKIWGVSRDSNYDFAYVVKEPKTKVYKCHVFHCNNLAEIIAKKLHNIWVKYQEKLTQSTSVHKEPEKMLSSSEKADLCFTAVYLGKCQTSKVSGINVLRSAIKTVCSYNSKINVEVFVSTAEVTVKKRQNEDVIVNCRMRYISFLGMGDDVRLFAFISVLNNTGPLCYVFLCPDNSHLPLAVREACLLRYQTLMESKSTNL